MKNKPCPANDDYPFIEIPVSLPDDGPLVEDEEDALRDLDCFTSDRGGEVVHLLRIAREWPELMALYCTDC